MTDSIETPAEFIPVTALAYGVEGSPGQLVTSDNPLPVGVVGGGASTESPGNVTQTPLGSSATFTGAWEVNSSEHVVVNVLTDQPGTLFVDFAIVKDGEDPESLTDADVVETLNAPQPIYANVPYFRVLVKGPGRAFRVRYVNDATAQSELTLFTAYGNNLFPPSVSADNELLTTTKKSLRADFFAIGTTNVSTDEWRIAIDLSDDTNFPHANTGAIVLSAIYLSVDKANTSQGIIQLGIITRIDGTDADVEFVQGFSFEKSSSTSIVRDRDFGLNAMNCGVSGGTVPRVASGFRTNGITALNTGVTLATSIGGTATPAVGDAVVFFGHSSGGSFNPAVSGFYYTERT